MVTLNEKVIIPKTLQKKLIEQAHQLLVHPGIEREYNTLR